MEEHAHLRLLPRFDAGDVPFEHERRLFHLIVSEIRSSTPRTMSRTASIAAERVSESRDERVAPPGPSAYRGA
jgi:hypothetical protein